MESSWRPASAEEGFEIVRRRLFDDLPAQAAPTATRWSRRSATSTAARRLSSRQECTEGDYERRLTAAYPIHPELFDRLYDDWSTLDKFQRTRGVLRLMAAVIHELWERNDSSLLIMPASVPIDAPAVSTELTRYLEEGWTPVIESDVDGPNAAAAAPRPREPEPRPLLGDAARGAHDLPRLGADPASREPRHRRPDDQARLRPAGRGAGDLRRRAATAHGPGHLPVRGRPALLVLAPALSRPPRPRPGRSHFNDDDVDEEIRRRLAAATSAGQRGDFAMVHPAPRTPSGGA